MLFVVIYKWMLNFYILLILGYLMILLLSLEYKIVIKKLLDFKVNIFECEYDFDWFYVKYM